MPRRQKKDGDSVVGVNRQRGKKVQPKDNAMGEARFAIHYSQLSRRRGILLLIIIIIKMAILHDCNEWLEENK